MTGITLKQIAGGRWKAAGPALKYHSVILEGDTPNGVLARARNFLDEYERFLDHLYGLCDAVTCDTCKHDKELDRETRGLQTGKRPKRYDKGLERN